MFALPGFHKIEMLYDDTFSSLDPLETCFR